MTKITSTLDVLKEVLNGTWELKTLEALYEDNLDFKNLKKAVGALHNNQVSRAVSHLNRLGLVDHVFTKSGDFYRISARGKKILEILKNIEKDTPLEAIC